eukprot:jgi/Bigna1/90991/estExt_fgenesh1_pg.C_850051
MASSIRKEKERSAGRKKDGEAEAKALLDSEKISQSIYKQMLSAIRKEKERSAGKKKDGEAEAKALLDSGKISQSIYKQMLSAIRKEKERSAGKKKDGEAEAKTILTEAKKGLLDSGKTSQSINMNMVSSIRMPQRIVQQQPQGGDVAVQKGAAPKQSTPIKHSFIKKDGLKVSVTVHKKDDAKDDGDIRLVFAVPSYNHEFTATNVHRENGALRFNTKWPRSWKIPGSTLILHPNEHDPKYLFELHRKTGKIAHEFSLEEPKQSTPIKHSFIKKDGLKVSVTVHKKDDAKDDGDIRLVFAVPSYNHEFTATNVHRENGALRFNTKWPRSWKIPGSTLILHPNEHDPKYLFELHRKTGKIAHEFSLEEPKQSTPIKHSFIKKDGLKVSVTVHKKDDAKDDGDIRLVFAVPSYNHEFTATNMHRENGALRFNTKWPRSWKIPGSTLILHPNEHDPKYLFELHRKTGKIAHGFSRMR